MRLLTVFISIPVILIIMSFYINPEKMTNGDQNQKPLFSFGLIADIQYADSDPAGTRFYRSSLQKLREAVTDLRKDSVDFVITLGDMIDKDIKSYDPILDILDSSGLMFYHVTGNHDYSVDPKDKRRLPSVFIDKPGYYSFTHENFRLIFLNGNEISTYSSKNKTVIKQANALLDTLKKKGEPNSMEWNGGISDKQIMWLNNQMNEATIKNEKVLIFCHFPVFPENAHNLLNYKDLLIVLGKYQNTIAWFNGHNHAGNYGNFNKTHFVTMKGMVETERQNSFSRIDLYKNKIWIIGSGLEKSQILSY